VTADNVLGLAVAAVIIAYLVLALIHPERF
jgi:K+-transporting ATPase KdpF subunit